MTTFSWLAALGSRKSSKVLRQASGEGRNLRDDDMSTMRTKPLGDGVFFKSDYRIYNCDLSVITAFSLMSVFRMVHYCLIIVRDSGSTH